MTSAKETAQAAIDAPGLTIESVFVPFSQSRNKAGERPTLNWRVTVKCKGREVLTTDYSAGAAHCPAKASKCPATYRARDRRLTSGKPWPGTTSNYRAPSEAEKLSDFLKEWRTAECESGLAMEYSPFVGENTFKPKRIRKHDEMVSRTVPILPDATNVIYSLVIDSSVLDHATFESWASEFGYDPDSRKGESIYRACLEIALKMRAAIGDAGMAALREAFQDY